MNIIDGAEKKQLAQLRPANTDAASLYSPTAVAVVEYIYICNSTANPETFRVFHDDDGTTYDQTTTLFYDTDIAAYSTVELETKIYMNNKNGNLAVRTSTGSALTFTAYGEEKV